MKDRFRKLFTNVWNIPNVLTMLRIILIPVFVAVFFSTPHDRDKIAALVIFAAASITDMFDGMLARKLNQITDFGKLFDPLADKVMVVTAMVCQALIGVFPWIVIIIVGVKELIMTAKMWSFTAIMSGRPLRYSLLLPSCFPSSIQASRPETSASSA